MFKITPHESVKVYGTSSCEKQFMVDGSICATRVMVQNIQAALTKLYPVSNSIFDYL